MTQVTERSGYQGPRVSTPLPPPPYPRPRALPENASAGQYDDQYGTAMSDTSYGYPVETGQDDTDGRNETATEVGEVTFDPNQPEIFFEAIVTDPAMTTDEKLAAIETAKQGFLKAGDTRLQVAESSAQYTRRMAEQSAREQKDAVARENAARQAEADERGRLRKVAAERDAAALLAEAEDQKRTTLAEQQLLARFPKKWPAAIAAKILDFNGDQHMAEAATTAIGYGHAATRFADDLSGRALREGERNLKRIEKAADRMKREQEEIAEQILAQANQAYLELRAAVTDAYTHADEMIRRMDLEARRRANDPSISLPAPASRSIPIDISPWQSADAGVERVAPEWSRPAGTQQSEESADAEPVDAHVLHPEVRRVTVPSFLRGRRGLIAGALSVVAVLGVGTVVRSGGDSPAAVVELQPGEAKAPAWASPSLKAWEPLITKTAKDRRIAAGGENYFAQSDQENVLYSLMALSSLGDPQYQSKSNLLNLDPVLMQSTGKEMGIVFDTNKNDPEQTFLIGERIIDQKIKPMLADPAKRQAYLRDRQQFYADLGRSLNVGAQWIDYFVGLNMEATEAQSPTFQKLYTAWKADYDTAAENAKQAGLLPK